VLNCPCRARASPAELIHVRIEFAAMPKRRCVLFIDPAPHTPTAYRKTDMGLPLALVLVRSSWGQRRKADCKAYSRSAKKNHGTLETSKLPYRKLAPLRRGFCFQWPGMKVKVRGSRVADRADGWPLACEHGIGSGKVSCWRPPRPSIKNPPSHAASSAGFAFGVTSYEVLVSA
jgi:hypothetical protein